MTESNLEQNKVEFFRSRLIEALKHRRINLKQNNEESDLGEEFWDGFHAGINECIGIVERFLAVRDVKALDRADVVSVLSDGINQDAKIGRDNLRNRFTEAMKQYQETEEILDRFLSLDDCIIKKHKRICDAYKNRMSSDAKVVGPNATATEKDGDVVIEGKVGSKIEYNRVVSSPSPPEVKTYTIKQPAGNRDLVLSLPAGATLTDGYHTFKELYEHRHHLFLALASYVSNLCYMRCVNSEVGHDHNFDDDCPLGRDVWMCKSGNHDGYFLMGIFQEKGKQIAYHLPMYYWDLVVEKRIAKILDTPPEFDGHTSDDVLERLKELI